jgi:hypothetical protein
MKVVLSADGSVEGERGLDWCLQNLLVVPTLVGAARAAR